MLDKILSKFFTLNITFILSQVQSQTKVKIEKRSKGKKSKSRSKQKSTDKSSRIEKKIGSTQNAQGPQAAPKKVIIKARGSSLKRSQATKPVSKTKTNAKDQVNEMPEELKWLKEDPHELLLSRFVETPKGTKLGESIGIDKKMLILKNKLNFYSIPLNSVKEKGPKLVLRRKVNWDKAAKLGETWRKNTLDYIKPKPEAKHQHKPRAKPKLKQKTKPVAKTKKKSKSKKKKSKK